MTIADKADKADQADQAVKTVKADKSNQADKAEQAVIANRADKGDSADNGNSADKVDQTDQAVKEELINYLCSRAENNLLPLAVEQDAAEKYVLSLHKVEEEALMNGLMPLRYQRNSQSVSPAEQLKLLHGRVAVLGCGGLGCYIIEELARLGVGTLLIIDYDRYEEHNLNRQLFAEPGNLGRFKADVAGERIKIINPAVSVKVIKEKFTGSREAGLLAGYHVVVDALDSIAIRLTLGEVCARLKIPLVHGAIGGFYGQVLTQFPGENLLQAIYRNSSANRGIEARSGNLSFVAGVVGGLQAAETSKILLNRNTLLRGRVLTVDLLDMEFEPVMVRH